MTTQHDHDIVLAAPVLCADGLLLSADTLQPLAWLAAALALTAAIDGDRLRSDCNSSTICS